MSEKLENNIPELQGRDSERRSKDRATEVMVVSADKYAELYAALKIDDVGTANKIGAFIVKELYTDMQGVKARLEKGKVFFYFELKDREVKAVIIPESSR